MASALRLRLLPSRAACVRVARRGHGAHGHSHGHSHDSRAGGELRSTLPPLSGAASIAGARGPLPIGLELARALGNVGRALESHAQALVSPYADTFESVWYGQGLLWRRVPSGEWEATLAEEELTALRTRQAMPSTRPAMLSLYFGDDRTALVKTLGSDGRERFLSMLRLDGTCPASLPEPLCLHIHHAQSRRAVAASVLGPRAAGPLHPRRRAT